MNRPPRRWIRWVAAGIAVLVVLVVGGPFVYFHFIEGKAPAALSLSTAPSTTAASTPATGASTGASGTWKISAGSEVGYRVKETLFGQSHTAVGRTSAIAGSITMAGTDVSAASFSVDMTQVTSDSSERDGQFQGRIMDTSSFPTATFVLTAPIKLGTLPADGTTITTSATGKLTLHGTTKSVTFTVQARKSGATMQVSGSMPITFADYQIDNPSGGPASVGNSGTLEFLLNLGAS